MIPIALIVGFYALPWVLLNLKYKADSEARTPCTPRKFAIEGDYLIIEQADGQWQISRLREAMDPNAGAYYVWSFQQALELTKALEDHTSEG